MNRRSVLLAALLSTIFVSGLASAEGRAIVPVAGSTAGVNGANFRTEMQLHNPGAEAIKGSISFLPQGDTLPATLPPGIDYEIGARATLRYEDIVASLGASGLGSIDVVATEGALPRIVVRAFDDQGNFGTRGLVVPAVKESEVPVIGYRFVLVAPANVETYRFNIGVRTLGGEQAKLRVTEHDASGAAVGEPFELAYLPETFRQKPAADLLGRTVVAGHSYAFETIAGSAIVYATTVDNKSNDGALQLDRPVNRPPVIGDQTIESDKDEVVVVTLEASDPDGDPIRWSVIAGPEHGTLSALAIEEAINAPQVEASATYTPDAGFVGSDTFTIGVEDDVNGSATAEITLNVGTATGAAPVAVNDAYETKEGETLEVAAPGPLANDSDPEGNPLEVQLEIAPISAASFTLNADGSFTYVPAAGFYGNDSFAYRASDGANTSNLANVRITVEALNAPPDAVADAATTDEDTPVGINVVANDSDPEGGALTVVSVNTGGTLGAVTIGVGGVVNYNPTGSATLQALGVGATATDTFGYTIEDAGGATATATVTVTVTGIDDVPTATADSATLPEDSGATAINVLANDVDVDGGPTFLVTGVTQGTNGAVAVTGGGTGLTYTPAADFCGSDSFTYTITGGSTATVTVTVICVNDAPTANGDAQATTEDTPLVFAASTLTTNDVRGPANEAGQTLTVAVVGTPTSNGGSVVLSAGNITYTPPPNFIGSDTFGYTVTDNGTTNGSADPLSANGTVTVTITCPTITVNNPATTTGTVSAPFSQTFTQTGDVGGGLTFATASTLPTGLTLSTAGVLSGTPTQPGSFPIVVTATNGNSCSGTGATYTLVIACQTITVTNPANANGTGGAAFSETFTQSGSIGTATFSTASTLPTGLTLSTAGVLSGTPTQTGSFPIVVTVTDSNGCTGTGATYTLVIACPAIFVTNPANANGTAGTAFSETFTQTGAIGTATFTTASTLPAGLTLATTGVLSGTPTVTGSFPIVVTVTDSNGCTGTGATYTLVLACPTISVTNPANTNGAAGTAFSETFTQTGAVGTATFTTSSTLPAGLTLSAAGVLSGTPTVTGSFPIVVTVTDDNSCTGTSATYTLVIGCQTITVTNPATTTGTVNALFSQTFTQTSAVGTATFTTASTLPAGLTLSAAGVLSGTPTQPGSFPIVVTVTDDNSCTGTSATYTLVIGCQTITVTSPATTTGTVSTPFSQTFTQSGAVGTATFTTASTLPTGLTLATNGTLSGTPTQTGSFPIVVTATDSNGCTGTSATYTLVIGCQVITVTNPANATGPAGSPFSETFTQTGAIGTATFTTASILPTGLTLATNGVLSGTPTQGGTFPIVVTVTDSNGCTGTGATYNLTITCPVVTVIDPANANGTANSAFSETFTQTGGNGTITWTLATGTLPTGLTLATNGTLSGTPTQTGSFPITVTATDQNGCTGTGTTYTIVIACQTITVNNPANANGTANAAFSETFTQTGGIGTNTFTLASGVLPTGLTLASNGVLSGTPTQTGSFPITVTATDANGCTGTSATYTIVIACQTITVTNPATTTGTINAPFSQTFTQTNAIGATTFTTASTLPSGLTLAADGTLSGTPTQSGNFPIVVTVTDANGCTGTGATYNLVIGCQTINVTNPVNTSGTVGSPFSETFTQSGAIGSATFTTASTLPTGLTLSAAGVLSGTPTQAGSFPIVVTVTDSNGCTGSGATYTLVVACNVVTVTNPGVSTGTAGTAFSQTFTQVGGNGTITWSLASGSLPSGITLNSSSGALSGTTTQTGSFPITVTATDQNGCFGTGATYTLVINCQTITVTNPIVNSGTAGSAFSQTFTQTGILGTPTWSVIGTLPTGIGIDPGTGVLSGTTTQTGAFPITVRVTDTNGCFDDSSYTLTIVCQTIAVTNPGVTAGVHGAVFSQTFTVTGILGTATWSVTGTLPAGVTLNSGTGVLSGTPTQTGSFLVTVRATDTNGCFDDSAYTLAIAPAANNDSITNLVGNTQAVVTGGTTATPTTPVASLAFAARLTANDSSDMAISATAGTFATTLGGSVTLAADGTFIYTPPVGSIANDTFTYTITSNSILSAPATVTLSFANRVWYVRNDAANGGLGRSSDPFDTLAEAETASSANDYIFVHFGGGTTNSQNAGIVLKAGQRLIGEFMGLSIPQGLNGAAAPTVLLAQPAGTACGGGPCRPLIGQTGAGNSVVTATNVIPAEISGLSLDPPTGASNAIDVTNAVAIAGGAATLVINQNVITDSGAEGIDINLNLGTTGTLTLDIQNTTFSGAAGTNGIDVTRAAGTVIANISNNANILATGNGIIVSGGAVASTTITGLANNSVSGNTTGAGVVISNATFDSDAVAAGIQQVNGGVLAIGANGNPVTLGGLLITTSQGNLFFSDLDIYSSSTSGTALQVSGPSMTFGVTKDLSGGSSIIQSTNGPGIDISQVTLDLELEDLDVLATATSAVSLSQVGGIFSAPAAASLSKTSGAGTAFSVASSVSGMSVSYAGTMNVTSGAGVSLTSNTGSTIAFTGALTISSGANAAFAATGGGTVTSTNTASTLTTTTGTALNVANTTIGASGLTFRSIASNGATNGIVLNGTGSNGLQVQGNGGTCSTSANCTGGAILNSTNGVLLTNAHNVSLTRMFIQNSSDSGIKGSSSCSNFSFANGVIDNSGTGGGAQTSNIAFNTDAGGNETNITGTFTVTGSTLTNARFHGISVKNFGGTLTNVNVSNNTITSSTSTATSLGSGIQFLAYGGPGGGSTANISGATINQNIISNFPSDAGIMVQGGNAVEGGASTTVGTGGTPITITNNTIAGQSAANRMGTQGILFNVNGTGTGNFNVSNNNVSNTVGNSISHNVFGDAVVTSTISGNTVVSNNQLGSQGIAGGTSTTGGFATNTPSLTVTITNNNVSQTDGNGILMVARDSSGGQLNIAVKSNTVAAPLGGVRPGIRVDAGNATGDNDVCLDISGNTSAGSGGSQGIGLRKQGTSTTVNAFGIEGLPADGTPNIENYVNGQNPAGNGTLLISATSGFTSCGSAP